jgi:4-oxalocrotonate tautomerase
MPLVTIDLISDVFSAEEKARMIQCVTDAVVSVAGETLRPATWVRVQDYRAGEWGMGGKTPGAADIRAMRADLSAAA